MGIFRRSRQLPQGETRERSPEQLDMVERIQAADPWLAMPTYWCREPGDSRWQLYTLMPGMTFDDLVRIRPEGTEFQLAEPSEDA